MPKRQRASTDANDVQNGQDKHQLFMQWAKDRGVEINGVKPENLPGRGLGLVTTQKLKDGERILFIPEKAMFKPDLPLLEKEGLKSISPQAQLAASAMLAFTPTKSAHQMWQDTWPPLEDFKQSMPIFWGTDAGHNLPPSAQLALNRQFQDLGSDAIAMKGFIKNHKFTDDDLRYYWIVVNSRSFSWKPAGSKTGMMVMCPFIDYLNHGPTGSSARVTMNEKGYYVTAERDYEVGEEVLATYGAHSNDKLLIHYGFICSSTPNGPSVDDSISLDHLLVPQLSSTISEQLLDAGYLGGYALLPAKNELCFRTQVAVRANLLTCNEWEYFVASGEDLSEDASSKVDMYVKVLLMKEYRKEAVKHAKADSVIGARWKQIIAAIDKFHRIEWELAQLES